MRLYRIILYGLFGYLFLFLGISLVQALLHIQNNLFDLTTILLTICLCLVLSVFLITADKRSSPLILLLCIITILWFLIRLLVVRLYPDSISYQYIVQTDAKVLNFTLLYFILATISAGWGLKAGSHLRLKRRLVPINTQDQVLRLPFSAMSTIFMGSLSMIVYTVADYGYGVGRGAELGHFKAVLLLLFNYDTWLIIATVSVANQWSSLTKIQKWIVVFFYSGFIIMRVLYGSKSAVYVTLMTFLFYYIAQGIDIRFKKKHLIIIATLALISLVGFAYGDAFRKVRALESIAKQDISAQFLIQNVDTYLSFDSIKDIAISATSRLSILEYLIVNLNKEGDNLFEYMNLVNPIKMILNLLLPGTPFPDLLYSSRYFQVVYGGQSIVEVTDSYFTDMWPIYGLFYVYFGILFGLIAIFISCLLLSWCHQRLKEIKSHYRVLLATFSVYLIHEFILSMGIDEWAQRIVLYVLSGSLSLFLLHVVEMKYFKHILTSRSLSHQ